MLTFESASVLGATAIVEKLSVRLSFTAARPGPDGIAPANKP